MSNTIDFAPEQTDWAERRFSDGVRAVANLATKSDEELTYRDILLVATMGDRAKEILFARSGTPPAMDTRDDAPGHTQQLGAVASENRVRRENQIRSSLRERIRDVSLEGPEENLVARLTKAIPDNRHIVYEQRYNGIVRSAGKETIRIDFEIDGDLVTRKFRREDLEKKWKGEICEEDRVGVTTTMALVSPEGYRPTEDEIEQFRQAEEEERRIRGMKDPQED